MEVYWLEQAEADVPAPDDWLSASDAACLDAMRMVKRRADWRLGRWAAKRALAAYWRLPGDAYTLSGIEIRPAASGAPEVFLSGQPAAVSVSLSHSSGVAICAVAQAGTLLGCDLEVIEPRSPAFISDYFTVEEQELIARAQATDRPQLATLLWSAKESALKALGEGLRLDTREVAVNPAAALAVGSPGASACWRRLQVHCRDGQLFHGWWWHSNKLVRTLIASPPSSPPIMLEVPARA
jgi:4'-phosphopantetheinyl transferase